MRYFLLLPACLFLLRPTLGAARPPESGQKLYNMYCARCHGQDGRLGVGGAHDLTKSTLNATGRTYMITNGFGKMPGFKADLSPAEAQRVAEYSLTLK